MPDRPPSKCRWPGCRRLVLGAYCAPHNRLARQASRIRPLPKNWRKLRAMILARDPACVRCKKKGRIRRSTVVDHIIPRADGGDDSEDNLQGLCRWCDSEKQLEERALGVAGGNSKSRLASQ